MIKSVLHSYRDNSLWHYIKDHPSVRNMKSPIPRRAWFSQHVGQYFLSLQNQPLRTVFANQLIFSCEFFLFENFVYIFLIRNLWYTYIHTYIYIYIYIYVCVCVCVRVREREREYKQIMGANQRFIDYPVTPFYVYIVFPTYFCILLKFHRSSLDPSFLVLMMVHENWNV